MKVKGLLKFYLPAVAVAMGVGSCQDYNADFSEEALRKEQFAEQFAKDFGEIDPNQDWNMASRFTAKVDLGAEITGELKLYTDAPGLPGSKYVGRVNVVDGKATMDFDAEKGTTLFYGCVKNQQGRTLNSGYYVADKNTVLIADDKGITTRAASPVTKGSKVELRVERVRAAAIEDFKSGYPSSYKNYYEMCNRLKVERGGFEVEKWDINNHGESEYSLMHKLKTDENTLIPNLYRLSGVDFSQHDAGYTGKFLRQIFGNYTNKNGEAKEGVYKEGIDHVALIHHGNFNVEKDVVYTVGEGGGEVVLDCIWRGTQGTYDYFGYYYYTGDLTTEQLWNIDKYILIDEEEANTGMWIGGSNPNTLTQGKTARYSGSELYYDEAWEDLHGMQCATYMGNNENNLIRGTKIKLTYFGGATPSYTFPEGTKIGFFIGWNKHNNDNPYNNRLFFSDCAKTYELFDRAYIPNDGNKSIMTSDLLPTSFTSTHEKNNSGAYEGPDVRQFASTFKFGDITVLGFGDEIAGDKDLNDICFIVSGNIDEPEDNTPDDLPEPETQSWVMACEDLGGSLDYDFNDVVFSVAHATNEHKAKITALAAGGTLPVELTYKGNVLTGPNGGTHFNTWFDYGKIDDKIAINAGKTTANATGKSIEIEVPLDFSVASTVDDNKMGGFALNVYGGANDQDYTTITAPSNGDAPQMMCLPGDWVWPKENDRITLAYPAFGQWGQNYNVTNWYKHYNDSYLVRKPVYESIDIEDITDIDNEIPGDDDGGSSSTLPEHSFTLTIGSTDVTDGEYEVVVGTTIDNLGLPSDNGFTVTSLNTDVAVVSMDNAGNAYNHSITTKAKGTAVIRVTKAADAGHKLTTHTVTLKVVEQEEEPTDPVTPEDPEDTTPDATPRTNEALTIGSNGKLSLDYNTYFKGLSTINLTVTKGTENYQFNYGTLNEWGELTTLSSDAYTWYDSDKTFTISVSSLNKKNLGIDTFTNLKDATVTITVQ